MHLIRREPFLLAMAALLGLVGTASAVDFQPLASNVDRLNVALRTAGFGELPRLSSYPSEPRASELINHLEPHVALVLAFDLDGKLYVSRGRASIELQQHGHVPLVYQVVNPRELKGKLTVTSTLAGPVYGGGAVNALTRQDRLSFRSLPENEAHPERRLDLTLMHERGAGPTIRGLDVEYGLLLMGTTVAGKLDAPLRFEFAPDPSSDAERPAAPSIAADFALSCTAKPAVKVNFKITDEHGRPSLARLTIRDAAGRVYPAMPKRLAPDFFFQEQIYRADGEFVYLPPGGTHDIEFSRGPEYRRERRPLFIPPTAGGVPVEQEVSLKLVRWVDPQSYGFYGGDHHIHGAGCSHYTAPTEGVSPADMFRQVKGEGLNVGCVLTWGPCYDFQRRYFSPEIDAVSEPFTLLKYDVEVSGFGSARLGHVCLLNLRDQTYPGSNGTVNGWPTWTVPVMQWARQQGGAAGYAHSASGMQIVPAAQMRRLMSQLDADRDDYLIVAEAKQGVIPETFAATDADGDGRISLRELEVSHERAAATLPNYAIPELNGPGAMEICVAAAHGACDFISSMDTARIQEWTIWYHLLNCGLPIATSGETDFPCMSGSRVGQGRVYVQLGTGVEKLDYAAWCRGLAAGHSYVSDGFAHALDFTVAGKRYGGTVELAEPGLVDVTAEVAFGSDTPPGTKHGLVAGADWSRIGNTVTLDPDTDQIPQFRDRRVEVIVNGRIAAMQVVPADDAVHQLSFRVPIEESSWVAIRQFPQLHTNPIRVLVGGRPVRASRRSAEWCVAVIEQLWKNRAAAIAETERPAAERAYEEAKRYYRRIAAECGAARLQ